jgi:hypothetical protein
LFPGIAAMIQNKRFKAGLPACLLLTMLVAWFVSLPAVRPSAQAAPLPPTVTRQPLFSPANAPGAWPWMAALIQAGVANPADGHFCGGALIHRDWVLTAAHCTYDRSGAALLPGHIEVIVGRHRLSSNEGSRLGLSQIVRHPNYRDDGSDFDVALLRLNTPANQTPIRLIGADEPALEAAETLAMVTGWGLTTPGDSRSASDVLRQVSVPLVSHRTCTFSYGLLTGLISPRMMCAGYRTGGRDSCNGDSGGPLMVYHEPENAWVQVGVVSWGIGCAEPYYYGIYGRLSQFNDWLTTQIPDLERPPPTPSPTPLPTPSPTATLRPTTPSVPSHWSHLPLVSRNTRLPLFNGNFEQGNATGWQSYTLRRPQTIAAAEEVAANLSPHSGRYVGWLGGANQEVSVIEQRVTAPADRPILHFWYQIRSLDVCGWDFAGVVVNDKVVQRFDLCLTTSSAQWRQAQVNLSAYAGQEILLQLRAETDTYAVSSFVVDDVGWAQE